MESFFPQNWESIKIEEETEEGRKIESTIKVPSQVFVVDRRFLML